MAATEAPAVEAVDLSFALLPGGAALLKNVSFALPRGARCVMVGQNGAGKSTLLELLSGDKMAPGGSVRMLGQDPFRGSSGREVALVQGGWRGAGGAAGALGEEKAAFLKAFELLGFQGPALPSPPSAGGDVPPSRTARLLEALGMLPLLGRYCGSLSDGERRKVELARRLLEPRAVVLLDEATTDLDALARRALLDFLASDGCTVISVTHVFDGLETWATHLAHLHDGSLLRLEAVGATAEPPWHPAGGLFELVSRWLAEAAKDALTVAPRPLPTAAAWPAAAGEPASAVEVSALTFAYAPWSPLALSVEELAIPPGSRCLLVGPNGAGKSSLLSVLAGRRMVAQGEVRVMGCQPFYEHARLGNSLAVLSSEWKRQVAEIGAGRSLSFRELATSALNDLAADGTDMQVLAARMLRLIQLLGIDPTKPIGALSDGMIRRVQIALKLLKPSKVLLVDEVTADLDVLARSALLTFLREESEAGTCIVYCTHILDGLSGWATHLLRLRPGGRRGEWRPLPQAGVDLFRTVLGFLEEDAALPPPEVPAAPRPALPQGSGSEEALPSGWHGRAATQAGAYGSYAWNADRGSEDTWTYGSVAPPPMSVQQAAAMSVAQRQQVPQAAPFGAVVGAGQAPVGGAWSPPLIVQSAPAVAGDSPFGSGPRANALPVEALIASGALAPEVMRAS